MNKSMTTSKQMISLHLNPVVLAHFIIILPMCIYLPVEPFFRCMQVPGSELMFHKGLAIEWINADLNLGWFKA